MPGLYLKRTKMDRNMPDVECKCDDQDHRRDPLFTVEIGRKVSFHRAPVSTAFKREKFVPQKTTRFFCHMYRSYASVMLPSCNRTYVCHELIVSGESSFSQ
jgi:hypothetical protein